VHVPCRDGDDIQPGENVTLAGPAVTLGNGRPVSPATDGVPPTGGEHGHLSLLVGLSY
jgi:hypothetical protein